MVVVDTADSRKYFSNGEPSTLYVALENAEVVTYDNAPDRGGAPVNSPLLQNFFGRFDWESYRFLPLPMLDWPIRYCEAVFGKRESQPQERNTPSSSQPSDLVTWDKYQQLQADLKPLIDLHIERLYAVLDSIIDSDDQQDKFEICAPVLQTCLDHEFRVYRNFLEHGESLIAHFGDNDVSRMLFRCDIDLVEGVHVAEVSLRHKFRVRCKKQLDYVMHFAKFGIPAEDVFDFKSGDIVQFQNEDGEVQRGAITLYVLCIGVAVRCWFCRDGPLLLCLRCEQPSFVPPNWRPSRLYPALGRTPNGRQRSSSGNQTVLERA